MKNTVKIIAEYGYCQEYGSEIHDGTIQLLKEGDKYYLYDCEYRTSGGWESSVWDKDEYYEETTLEEFDFYIKRSREVSEEIEGDFYEVQLD